MTSRILNPYTLRPAIDRRAEEALSRTGENVISAEQLRQAEEIAKRRYEEQLKAVEQSKNLPTPEEIGARYKISSGRILVAKKEVDAAWDDAQKIAMLDDRADMVRQFEPWGTVLLIGDAFYNDHGQRIELDDEVKVGSRILFNPAGGQDVDIKVGDCTMIVTIIGFRNFIMLDRGAEAEMSKTAEATSPAIETTDNDTDINTRTTTDVEGHGV